MEMYVTYSDRLSSLKIAIYSIVLNTIQMKDLFLIKIFILQMSENESNWPTKLSIRNNVKLI